MTIKIVTDSTSDLTVEMYSRHDIAVVPLNVHFGDENYKDKVDLTPEQFYSLLKTSPHHPKTSQPSPADFKKVYADLLKNGKEIISLHISSKMSGTVQSAELAKKELGFENIHIVDSGLVSLPLGLLALECANARDNGKSVEDILALTEKLKKEIKIYFIVNTLEYLQKGGRIGKAQAIIGGLLNIKPILTVSDGLVTPFEKIRGSQKVLARLTGLFSGYLDGRDSALVRLGFAHADHSELLGQLKSKIDSYYNTSQSIVADIGPVVGAHAGPGTLAITFYEKGT